MTQTKPCDTCGNSFEKKPTTSKKKWETMKYCSNPCINKGRISRCSDAMQGVSQKKTLVFLPCL